MMRFDEETFARLIRQAIDSLPDDFRRRMENITVRAEPLADEATCRRLGLSSPYQLFGLYHGVPLTERSVTSPFGWPDSIVIYQRAIEAYCQDGAAAVAQIQRTVLHEIGHFFGLDEGDLSELGYG